VFGKAGARFGMRAQSFDRFASMYDRRDRLQGGWATEWLMQMLGDRHGGTAVDLGCAGGSLTAILAAHYDRVLGVDLSGEMIRLAGERRPHPRVTYEQGDLSQVTGHYDCVVSVMVLHHVEDPPRALAGIRNLVAPGGLALVVDFAGDGPSRRRQLYRSRLHTLVRISTTGGRPRGSASELTVIPGGSAI